MISDGTHICLLTAQHVANRTAAGTPVALLVDGQRKVFTLEQLAKHAPLYWVKHYDADVAALELVVDPARKLHAFQRSQIFTDHLVSQRERPIVVFGFPLGIGVEEFSPVTQAFSRASDPVTAKSDEFQKPATYYFLDRPSIEGYSGAPAFHVPGPFDRAMSVVVRSDHILVGVIAGTVSDKTGGKLGAVVPSRFAAEVFDRAIAPTPPPSPSPKP